MNALETIAVEVKIPKSSFRDPGSAVVCSNEACRRGHKGGPKITYVAVAELVSSPETVPDCCGQPMRLPSLAEIAE